MSVRQDNFVYRLFDVQSWKIKLWEYRKDKKKNYDVDIYLNESVLNHEIKNEQDYVIVFFNFYDKEKHLKTVISESQPPSMSESKAQKSLEK